MFKSGDVVQRLGGLETRHGNYRGEQIIYIKDLGHVGDYVYYSCMVYLCGSGTWLDEIDFSTDDSLTPLDVHTKSFYREAIINLLEEAVETY